MNWFCLRNSFLTVGAQAYRPLYIARNETNKYAVLVLHRTTANVFVYYLRFTIFFTNFS